MSWPWSELGLSGPAALPEIRSAYAQRLKATHPEEDPEGFQRLHTAYQEASRQDNETSRCHTNRQDFGHSVQNIQADRVQLYSVEKLHTHTCHIRENIKPMAQPSTTPMNSTTARNTRLTSV